MLGNRYQESRGKLAGCSLATGTCIRKSVCSLNAWKMDCTRGLRLAEASFGVADSYLWIYIIPFDTPVQLDKAEWVIKIENGRSRFNGILKGVAWALARLDAANKMLNFHITIYVLCINSTQSHISHTSKSLLFHLPQSSEPYRSTRSGCLHPRVVINQFRYAFAHRHLYSWNFSMN